MKKICVIDNSTLVNLTKLEEFNIFKSLKMIFTAIHVPEKILEEYEKMTMYEPERKYIVDQICLSRDSFLVYCSTYDLLELHLLRGIANIDAGEAEAAAQYKTLLCHYLLSDDKKFAEAIRKSDPYVRVINSLHLIAWLDSMRIIPDSRPYLRKLHRHFPFSSLQLREAYSDIIGYLSIPLDRRELSRKTSLGLLDIS